jgi:transcriptional regulator with XRE-family HTH domain
MPNRKAKTPGSDQVRERVIKVMKQLIARDMVADRQTFAEKLGTNSARINAWENQEGHPTLENLCALFQKFPVSEGYVISGRGEMFISEVLTLAGLDKRVRALERKK